MEGFLLYPAKSHRKIITIPNDSVELAELMGIVFGDGGINNLWQVVVTLSAIKDVAYSTFVSSLFCELFNIKAVVRKIDGSNAIRVICSSTNVVDFLVSKGAVRGHKIRQKIATPDWINQKVGYQKAFVRGLVDTDGCLYVHHHLIDNKVQHNIGFCFTSFSEKLLLSVARILKRFEIEPHITDDKKRIYLYSSKAVKRYLEIFGTSNERISRVYENWLIEKINRTGEVA